MGKNKLQVNDFKNFYQAVKSLSKMTNSAKFTINEIGVTVYGKNSFSRGELFTNALTSKAETEFCILDLGMFLKVLQTVLDVHGEDLSEVNIVIDGPFFRINSNKFKTKLTTCKEDIISNFISAKVHTKLTSVLQFTTDSNAIKNINGHSFIFQDIASARIYLGNQEDLENNVLYATIGNNNSELNNSITLKLGYINFGTLNGRKIILNFDILNLFNIVQSDSIVIDLMDKNVLVYKIKTEGENGTYYEFTIYNSMLAN